MHHAQASRLRAVLVQGVALPLVKVGAERLAIGAQHEDLDACEPVVEHRVAQPRPRTLQRVRHRERLSRRSPVCHEAGDVVDKRGLEPHKLAQGIGVVARTPAWSATQLINQAH